MNATTRPGLGSCNCLALRQAARHVTQAYDLFLAPAGLRATQYSILATLQAMRSTTINALARMMVMDRTTLGRNLLPLQREGLITVATGREDRRSKELRLSDAGLARLAAADEGWARAHRRFEERFGERRAGELRALLQGVVSTDLTATEEEASDA